MQNSIPSAETAVDNSTQAMLQRPAPITPNPMLAEAFSVRPILFSTPMVQAIMKGQKTQTRRIVKGMALDWLQPDMFTPEFVVNPENNMCPYGKVGDMLWVRETWAKVSTFPEPDCFGKYLYKSMGDTPEKWMPSIFMPKDACRIFLKLTDIRIERLHELSEADARAEGVAHVIDKITGYCGYDYIIGGYNLMTTPYHGFRSLWKKINGEQSWNENPFVWVITFERAECPQGFC